MSTASKNRPTGRPVLLLFGPTAVGKTDLLLHLLTGKAEVISADSMQVYQGMDIGTAKPSPRVRSLLPHHLIDTRAPDEGYSVGDFVREADELLPGITERGRIAVVSGGSAFYLRSFIYGLPETPRVDREIKDQLVLECERAGLEALRAELERVDPVSARRLPAGDRYRILRALEVYRSTGRPLSTFRVPHSPRGGYRFSIIGLERERSDLYLRIDERVDTMMADGLVEEVRGLVRAGYDFESPGMKGIGYREFSGYLRGDYSLERTKELIQRNSRRYAKRQITFFKQLPGVRWAQAEDHAAIGSLIAQFEGAAG